jgi:hypothetical protein
MAIEISETKVFNFSSVVDGTKYNFSMMAETRDEACKKLLAVLASISEDLKVSIKAGVKPN